MSRRPSARRIAIEQLRSREPDATVKACLRSLERITDDQYERARSHWSRAVRRVYVLSRPRTTPEWAD